MLLIIWAVCGIACAVVASNKDRSIGAWLVLGIFFPILALLIVACLPSLKRDTESPTEMIANGYGKRCPDCAEVVRIEARKCRFCGHEFDPDLIMSVPPRRHEPTAWQKLWWNPNGRR